MTPDGLRSTFGEDGGAPARSTVILLLAGEVSGDLHGAQLARALKKQFPGARLMGTGGPRMAAEGVEILVGVEELSAMGFAEVVARIPWFLRLERRILKLLSREKVDLVIPIDFPGFNLRVTRGAHALGVPVLFYIAPQVWAWRPHRASDLAHHATRIAVILPFEAELFEREGGNVEYVGHPLLDEEWGGEDREAFCRKAGLDPSRPILAIFPGSRRQETRRHLAPFLEAAGRLQEGHKGLQVAVARAPELHYEVPEGVAEVRDGRALLRHARAALVKSGTTTLEAALIGVPFVVAYRTHPLTFAIARRVVRVEHVALSNLVAGERVVPEFLQNDVTGPTLAAALEPLLTESVERERMLEGLSRVRAALGRGGAAARVAEMAAEILARGEA